MGTISDKLTYLNTTKSQLKDMINNGLPSEQQITSSTTFRNYVSSIFNAFLEALRTPDTLFTNLPKKSGTGANITLNDTANAPMRIELSPSELTQDGTPTPSSPQAVHTISGSNTIKIEGKNIGRETFDEKLNVSGTGQNRTVISSSYFQTEIIRVKSSTNYICSGDFSNLDSNIIRIGMFDEYPNINSISTKYIYGASSLTFKTDTTTKYILLINSRGVDTVVSNLLVCEAIYGSTYTPYTSQEADIDLGNIEYCKIGNYEDKFIRTSGKNLFDANVSNKNCTVSNQTITITASATDTYIQGGSTYSDTNKFLTLPAGTYYLKTTNSNIRVQLYGDNATIDSASTQPITLSNETNFGGIRVRSLDSSSLTNVSFQVMLSTSNIDYEPYGNGTWYIKKNIGKVVFNGSENWELNPYSSGGTYLYWLNATNFDAVFNKNIGDYINTELIYTTRYFNNYFTKSTQTNAIANNGYMALHNYLTVRWLLINYSDATSVEDFKTWLSTHNTTVYYVLATPTYTQITGTLANQLENVYQKLLSYSGTTNISQVNNDLSFNLSVQAIEEL